jgi:hypothetical protein
MGEENPRKLVMYLVGRMDVGREDQGQKNASLLCASKELLECS